MLKIEFILLLLIGLLPFNEGAKLDFSKQDLILAKLPNVDPKVRDLFINRIDFSELLSLLEFIPESLTLDAIIIILTQNYIIEVITAEEPPPEYIIELIDAWIDIIFAMQISSEAVTLGNLKPFLMIIAQPTSEYYFIIDFVNQLIFGENPDNQSVIDLLTEADDSVNLNLLLQFVSESLFHFLELSQNPPPDLDEMREYWFEVLEVFRTSGSQYVTVGMLKPFIYFLLDIFANSQETTTIASTLELTTSTLEPTTTTSAAMKIWLTQSNLVLIISSFTFVLVSK